MRLPWIGIDFLKTLFAYITLKAIISIAHWYYQSIHNHVCVISFFFMSISCALPICVFRSLRWDVCTWDFHFLRDWCWHLTIKESYVCEALSIRWIFFIYSFIGIHSMQCCPNRNSFHLHLTWHFNFILNVRTTTEKERYVDFVSSLVWYHVVRNEIKFIRQISIGTTGRQKSVQKFGHSE